MSENNPDCPVRQALQAAHAALVEKGDKDNAKMIHNILEQKGNPELNLDGGFDMLTDEIHMALFG